MKTKDVKGEVVITVGWDDPDKDSLASRIRDLPTTPKISEATAEPISDVLKKTKKKKKEKKKEKSVKKDSTSDILFEGIELPDIDENGDSPTFGSYALEAIDEYMDDSDDEEDDEEDLETGIIIGEKENYSKRKKSESYTKVFNEETTLLYGMLDETKKGTKDYQKQLKSMEASRARGASKYTNDLLANVISSRNTELQIVKELVSLKKTIADLDLKKEAQDAKLNGTNDKNGGGGGISMEDVSAIYLNQIMTNGRANFLDTLGTDASSVGGMRQRDDMDEAMDGDDDDMYMAHHDQLNSVIDERLENENTGRSSDGTRYIQHEYDNCTIKVKKNIETNEWRFVAMNDEGLEIPSYPLPDPKTLGKMTFSDTFVKDSRGRMYELIEVYDDLYY